MKTRNSKLQKTELNSLTNLIVLFAAVLVLNSQAAAIGKITHKNAGTKAYAEMVTLEHDAYLNIESWMLNENYFFDTYVLEDETEASLEVENWMTNSVTFASANYLETETEEALILAAWMINETNFMPSFSLETEMENAIELENWMIDAKNFALTYSLETESEEALTLEEWMLKESSFLPAAALEVETESILKLEEWMVNDSTFMTKTPAKAESGELAFNASEKSEKITTIEYKDPATGYTFLFKLAEVEEPELKLEKWMVDKKHWNRK